MFRRFSTCALTLILALVAQYPGVAAPAAWPPQYFERGRADPRLEGDWRLVRVDSVRAPSAKRRWKGAFVVRFADGVVTGKVACNGFFGPYWSEGARLHTTDLGQTTMGCGKPREDLWDEITYAAVKAGHFELTGGGSQLTLYEPQGRRFVFRRL